MGFYQFTRTQSFARPPEEVWEFISDPRNLKAITPEYMGFNITSNTGSSMYPGMIISYQVSPLWNIDMKWVTEITQVRENEYFVDEQRVGPYALWHHQHILEKTKDGTRMTDIVSYKPPFGVLGNIASPMIRKKLKEIFDYRHEALTDFLGSV